MLQRRTLLVVSTLFFLFAGRQRAVQHPAGWPLTAPPEDVFTFSKPAEVAVHHVALDLTVDFDNRRLHGTARLDIENLTGATTLVLDTEDLTVSRVAVDGVTSTTWTWGTPTGYGRPLNVPVTAATRSVTIDYATSPSAEGLNWNTAMQSFGRKQPYLYSLNEPVDARSWIPIQDTPSHRLTYEATIRVPRGLLALMSASDNPTVVNDTGIYVFHMPYKVPAYLIAIAVGRLEFHAFDERTGVYAEPELLEDAKWDLRYLPEMLDVAETIAGPFPFERHDVLLMPPTFVVGGMEHPMINFVNPMSVVSGNRLEQPQPHSLIAHELAHSWAGDSATLATWNDVWINEGITSYLTHRILEVMRGAAHAELGWYNDRRNYANASGTSTSPSTILHRQTPDPGAGFSNTGYVKGGLFIKTLEDRIGRATFDAFLRRYFQVFAYRWVDHEQFLALLDEVVLDARPALEGELALQQWLYEPGLPSNVTAATSSVLLDRAVARAQAFQEGDPVASLEPATWSETDLDLFLQFVSPGPRMAEIDAAFGLSARKWPTFRWLIHSIQTQYEPGLLGVERVLMNGGSNSLVQSLYFALATVDMARARRIFALARDRYHDQVEAQVAQRLGVSLTTNARRNAA